MIKDIIVFLSFEIKDRGVDVQILSFTIEEDRNRLWLIYEQEDMPEDELEIHMENGHTNKNGTNREKKREGIERTNVDRNFFINQIYSFDIYEALEKQIEQIELFSKYLQIPGETVE